ncbi:hypothetical protein WDW37_07775 [Bdellovibrionota bacterium FG-1]
MKFSIGLSVFLIGTPAFCSIPAANAQRAQAIRGFLQEFKAHPAQVMKRIPKKFDLASGRPAPSNSAFTDDAILTGEFVRQKDQLRRGMCKTTRTGNRVCLNETLPGRAPYEENDLVEDLVDNTDTLVRTLDQMETQNLKSAELAESPWSDSYWPIYLGTLGQRYADNQFPGNASWFLNQQYVINPVTSALSIFQAGDVTAIDSLSPSEKYDLLTGDSNQGLTQAMWSDGEGYYRENGSVENWMGICHGWAPASYSLPRPTRTVQVLAANGQTRLTFYPSDIKGLASLLWARTRTESRFIGGRCNEKDPQMDPNGRIISQDCFDTNPGTWHLTMINQIGVAKRSMVIDATYDYEVWNQPVYSYQYSYFNPQTGEPAETLSAAQVALNDFKDDKFKSYRSKNARTVVGIAMDLTYIEETNPSHAKTDSPKNDNPTTVRYMYDLELDTHGAIIGGEWYQNAHPDFIWTPGLGEKAKTPGDRFATGKWEANEVLPETWRKAAAKTAKGGMPLAKIVEQLIGLAQKK